MVENSCIIHCVIPSRYYTSLLFGLMVINGLLVFYLFRCPVINWVIWFSIYSVLQIWSNDPARSFLFRNFYCVKFQSHTSLVYNPKYYNLFRQINLMSIWIFEILKFQQKYMSPPCHFHTVSAEKSYTGESSASFDKLEKPVWRPKGRQLSKFRSMLFTIMKPNYCILLRPELIIWPITMIFR